MAERRYTYQHIADQLRSRIQARDLVPGQQLAPEPELATAYSVSRITLRKALEILESERLVVRQKGRGTFVAGAGVMPAAERQPTRSVLYLGDTSAHFWRDLYLAFLDQAQVAGWRVSTMLESRLFVDAPNLGAIEAELDDAAAIVAQPKAWERLINLGLARDRYVVIAGGVHRLQLSGQAQVLGDSFRAGRDATAHLTAQGHRVIAYVGSQPVPSDDPAMPFPSRTTDIFRGHRDALASAGIAFEPRLTFAAHGNVEDQFVRLLERAPVRPTAVVCDADFRAAPLLRAMRRLNLAVPGEVSLVGIANTPWCDMLEPRLTSMSLGEQTIARLALSLCENPTFRGEAIYVPPALVLRDSTGPVPRGPAEEDAAAGTARGAPAAKTVPMPAPAPTAAAAPSRRR